MAILNRSAEIFTHVSPLKVAACRFVHVFNAEMACRDLAMLQIKKYVDDDVLYYLLYVSVDLGVSDKEAVLVSVKFRSGRVDERSEGLAFLVGGLDTY